MNLGLRVSFLALIVAATACGTTESGNAPPTPVIANAGAEASGGRSPTGPVVDPDTPISDAGAGGVVLPPADPPPNIVLIVSDDQGYDDYSFMGHPYIQTPRLDQLAEESLVYTRGFVTTSLCSPSLATLLTGLYPHQHQITGNDPEAGTRDERPEYATPFIEAFVSHPQMPRLLGDAGYVSLQTGKYWMGHYEQSGFTEGMTVDGRHGAGGLDIGRETMDPIYDFVDRAVAQDQRFFVWYAPFMPHEPHTAPQRLLDKYVDAAALGDDNGPAYYAMVEWFDETVGQLLDYLDGAGVADDTLIIYIVDNGWPHSAKGSPYQRGTRTPVMIRWPGKVTPQRDDTTFASGLDVVPTILKAAGATPPENLPGLDLMDQATMSQRKMLVGETFAHDMRDVNDPAASLRARTAYEGSWELVMWQDPLPDVPSRNDIWKSEPDLIELYDYDADPEETLNLATSNPDVVQRLSNALDAQWP